MATLKTKDLLTERQMAENSSLCVKPQAFKSFVAKIKYRDVVLYACSCCAAQPPTLWQSHTCISGEIPTDCIGANEVAVCNSKIRLK